MTDDAADQMSALRAAAHPVRLRILSLLTGTAMSAAEVARELGISHANASYHLRQLLDVDELVIAGEETIRGGVAKKYRYPHERRGLSSRKVSASPSDQAAYARALGQELQRRVLQRRPRTKNQQSDLEGWVTPEIWEQALELLAEASHLLHDHNAAPHTPGTIHVSATSWAFQIADPPAEGTS